MQKAILTVTLFYFFVTSLGAQTSISGVINDYSKIVSVDFCNNTVVAENYIPFNVGDDVLLIQMGGAVLDLTTSASYGSILDYAEAGNYEIFTILEISFNIITFSQAMERTYNAASGRVQLVRMPRYDDVSVDGEVSAIPWNGSSGGIVAFIADGIVTFNENIDVTGQGFYGGDDFSHTLCYAGVGNYSGYSCSEVEYCGSRKGEGIGQAIIDSLGRGAAANAGGGGNDSNTGGGGGSNFGVGGIGGEKLVSTGGCDGSFPGLGGLALSYSNASNKIFMGGGGGSGDQNENDGTSGEPGGGIVLVIASEIDGNGYSIIANGDNVNAIASKDGAGGGGGAGTILLVTPTVSSTLNVIANGGFGGKVDNDFDGSSCNGPGGGGGGGALWISEATLPANIVFSAFGGSAGITINADAPSSCSGSANGAIAGSAGGLITNLILPLPLVEFIPLTLILDPDSLIICAGESISLSPIATGTGTLTYVWNNTPPSFGTSVSETPSSDFLYQITVTDERDCQITKTVWVDVIPNVIASASPDSIIIQGEFVTLFTNLDLTFDFLWTPTDANISNPASATPIVNPLSTTTYCVTVVSGQNACESADCITIEVITDVVIPNAFSPNGDGINDYFNIPDIGDICESIATFKIFNRWGEVVYDIATDAGGLGWNGLDFSNTHPAPIGTYIYFVELDCGDQNRLFTNDVILLR